MDTMEYGEATHYYLESLHELSDGTYQRGEAVKITPDEAIDAVSLCKSHDYYTNPITIHNVPAKQSFVRVVFNGYSYFLITR